MLLCDAGSVVSILAKSPTMEHAPLLPSDPPVPRNVKIGLWLAVLSIFILLGVWVGVGMYRSDYYSFGPSDRLMLAFVNIPIDTWSKYLGLQFYILTKSVLQVVGGDFVYPWINAYIMNPEAELKHDGRTLYIIANFYWGINSVHTIFFFALAASQVDFGIALGLWSTIGGLISSYHVIFDDTRKLYHLEARDLT